MAIDTKAKRAAALTFQTEDFCIFPDGTIDQGDRQAISGFYSGILAAAQAAVAKILATILPDRYRATILTDRYKVVIDD